ncbi:MAG: FAD-linked oxidase C-terminal domain-containing protein [Acidobacteriota bacterium]|jgi:glycolate oxidase|nr:FAD-linked oxidase C-terminal domain-containing protein [Acidobacteriota bacterium]
MIGKKVLKELAQAVGREKVFAESEYLLSYSYDATGLEYLPDAVVFAENEEDVAAVIAVCRSHGLPLVPRGAGVGYTGGALAVSGGVVLVFTRMNRILSLDRENFLAVVEPGVVTSDLQEAAEKAGLFYPPDPASLKTSTIGGNVAENAGGPRCFKYGVTGNYVLGLEAFLMNGEKVRLGAETIKNVAGYDLKSLLVGSEGTLAVVTRVTVRLLPLPPCRLLFRVDFPALEDGARFVQRVIQAHVQPAVLEFMDRSSLQAVYSYQGLALDDRLRAAVLVEVDGSPAEVAEREALLKKQLDAARPLHWQRAETFAEQEALWATRRNISPAIAKLKPKKINEDIVVPAGRIPEMVGFIDGLAAEYGLCIVLFGHFGDGNIHTNLMVDPDDAGEMSRAEVVLDKIFRRVVEFGGTISGEHGIGLSKKPFMHYQFSPVELELFRRIKKVFDPDNLLNPGKMF